MLRPSQSLSRSPLFVALLLGSLSGARLPFRALRASLDSDLLCEVHVKADGSRLIVDPAFGWRFELKGPPQRVVSLTLASDAMLSLLLPPHRVAAVTSLVDDPDWFPRPNAFPPSIPRIRASAEAIVRLNPDLVLFSGYSSAPTLRLVASAGTPVLRLPSGNNTREVRQGIEMLGKALFVEAKSIELIAHFDEERKHLESMPSFGLRALFLSGGQYTHGAGTLTDELLKLGGVENAATQLGLRGFVRIGPESILRARPDLLVIPATDEASARGFLARALPALRTFVEATKVVPIPPYAIESPGPDCLEASKILRASLARLLSGNPEKP
ncbi:MAG: ABC transporter substrate-binding protein [Sandaracinaceae bacterium]|nr:ABC transporter substrate-binding protein [Sandaracinaceae bacterium]MDW8246723.1 ABC transporter substrate-binding protein [Sandaracinaceae bacterium]